MLWNWWKSALGMPVLVPVRVLVYFGPHSSGISLCALFSQGMAYALLAGLLPKYGLYSVFFAPMCYTLLGTSPELSVGPVAMVSLIVAGMMQPRCWVHELGYVHS